MAYETISIEMSWEEAAAVYRYCSEHRITLDELVDRFLRWCIREPEAFKKWYEECSREEASSSITARDPLNMPEITQRELIAHIEDEDFLRVYGNPVLVCSDDGKCDCVLMSVEYFERMEMRIRALEAQICALNAGNMPSGRADCASAARSTDEQTMEGKGDDI